MATTDWSRKQSGPDRIEYLVGDVQAGRLDRRALLLRGALLGLSMSSLGALLAACGDNGGGSTAGTAAGKDGLLVPGLNPPGQKDIADLVVKMQVFIKQPYYERAGSGGEQAAKDLGIRDYKFGGPAAISATEQVAQFNTWISQQVDVICTSAADAAMGSVINRAARARIATVTFDLEAGDSERMVFIAPVNANTIGRNVCKTLTETTGKGPMAIISATPTSATHELYVGGITDEAKDQGIDIVDIQYGESQVEKSYNITKALLTGYPDLVGIMVPEAAQFPAVCQAVTDAKSKVRVSGLSLPSLIAPYMRGSDPVCPGFWLWDPRRVGYVAMQTAVKLYKGEGLGSSYEIDVATGKKGTIQVEKSPIVKGKYVAYSQDPILYTPDNVGDAEF